VQRRHQRDGLLHVRDGVLADHCRLCVQLVQLVVLPERDDVPCLPLQLHDLRQQHDVQPVRWDACCSARRRLVRERLPDRLLLERRVVPCVRLDVRDVQRRRVERVSVVQERFVGAVPERDDVRRDVPDGDVPEREQRVHCVQHQLCDVQRERVDVPDLPCEPAVPCAEHVCVR